MFIVLPCSFVMFKRLQCSFKLKIKLISFKHSRTSEEYCFQYAAINNWNTLSNSITCVTNFNQFKCKSLDFS